MIPKSFQMSSIGLIFVSCSLFLQADDADSPQDSNVQEPTYLLRFQFREGDELRYQMSQQVTQNAVAAARSKVDISKVDQRRVFHVSDVTDSGDARVSMQFENVRMEVQSDDNPPEIFESSMKPAEVPTIFRPAAQRLKGTAPEYTVYSQGTPVNEDGYEDVPDIGQASFMMPLPENAVPVGESWKVFVVVKVRLAEGIKRKIKLLRTYKLEKVEDGIATIRFSTSVAARVRAPAAKAQLLQATPQGTITFDINRGRVTHKVMTFDRSVLGALGANTILSSTGKTTETLLAGDDDTDASVTKR